MTKAQLLSRFIPINLWIKKYNYIFTFDEEEQLLLIHAYITNEASQKEYLGLRIISYIILLRL